jgi:hypothetical protein
VPLATDDTQLALPAQTALHPTPAPPAPPALWRRLVPVVSLVLGVVSALMMDRGPGRAALVALSAIGLWATLLCMLWLGRTLSEDAGPLRRRLVSLAHFLSLLATQSLVQLALFFALPFYLSAAGADPAHLVFLALLLLLSAATLWDPLTERMLTAPLVAPLLPAVGSFAALTAVLPGLGMSTEHALWVAAATSGAGALLIGAAGTVPGRRGRVLASGLVVVALLPLSLWLGAARIVPAAPLRLVRAEIGTHRDGKWVVGVAERFAQAPGRLFCATAIASPVGVRDRLFHLWTKDGVERARVALDIRGGRSAGYRTQSRITVGSRERGTFRCNVVTASGQRLGGVSVRVGHGS